MELGLGLGLTLPRRRGGGLLYRLYDDFTTDRAAGTLNGTAAEPGPGTRTVVDAESKLSLASGIAVTAGGKASAAWGDPGINYPLQTFPSQCVLDLRLRQTSAVTNTGRRGFRSGESAFCDVSYVSTGASHLGVGPFYSHPRVVNTWYDLRIISTTLWSFYFVRATGDTTWTLGTVQAKAEPANLYPAITNFNVIANDDFIKLYDSTGWGDYGQYSGYEASEAGAIAGSADGFLVYAWTPQAGEILEIKFRKSDASNYLLWRCDQAAGTTKIYEVVAGVETEKTGGTTTQTWSVDVPVYLYLRLVGTGISVFISGTGKNSTTSTHNQSATGAEVSGATVGRDLVMWPLSYAADFITERTKRPTINILPIGDSKTAGVGTPFLTPTANDYVPYLCRSIGGMEVPTRIAAGGRSTATLHSIIDAQLAAATGTPDYVLYNMGRNDIGANHATWQTQTAYIFDAIHAKWPNAHIYVARGWANDATAMAWLTTMNSTDIPAVIASRSWCHLGPDERTFLNLDNSPDGTHQNSEGYIEVARQWKAVLGL